MIERYEYQLGSRRLARKYLGAEVTPVLEYTFYANGNVQTRTDRGQATPALETYFYDAIDRLREVVRSDAPGGGLDVQYDALGNIRSKTGVGIYDYDSGRPHAVSNAGGTTITYDPNGNMLTRGNLAFEYTAFDKTRKIIASGAEAASFEYGPDEARVVRRGTGSTRVYIGSLYELELREDGTTERRFYVSGESATVATVVRSGSAQAFTTEAYSLRHDQLGTVHSIGSSSGTETPRRY